MDEKIKTAIRERANETILERVLNRGGRPALADGEGRSERTTIRWKPDELDVLKRVAAERKTPLGETIRALALEAARR